MAPQISPTPSTISGSGTGIRRPVRNDLSSDLKKHIADCFLRLADLPSSVLDRLSRYEHTLWRQARQIVFTLESLRRRKRAPVRSTFAFSFRRREPGDFSEKSR